MAKEKKVLPAIDEMRAMVNYFNSQHEGVNMQLTHEQLLKVWTFLQSEQGGRVHECYDHWPDYLFDAVLEAKRGATIDAEIVKRAEAEVS